MIVEENKNESLEKINTTDVKPSSGRLIYDDVNHMNELVKEILAYHEKDGVDLFEQISMYIKRKMTKLSFQYIKPLKTMKKCVELTNYEEKIIKSIMNSKSKSIDQISSYMDDILSQSRVLEWAGISFNRTEWVKIRISMKKLLLDTKAESIKFWGKIYGTEQDYYILYGIFKDFQESLDYNKLLYEKRGTEGINRFLFWVSNSCLEDWYELPDVSSEQIIASKTFKYFFSGNLNKYIKGFNYFPGKEAHLLKCQILRIMHGTNIAPADYLRIKPAEGDLENRVVENNDEYIIPTSAEEMNSQERWVHEHANVLLAGRLIYLNLGDPEKLAALIEKEGYIERLRPIQADEPFGENKPAWNFRIVGDLQQYNQLPPKDGVASYSVLVIKSLRWPGFITGFKGGEFASVYIGFGIKFGGPLFIPQDPGKLESDPLGAGEFKEPNEPPKKEEPPAEDGKEQPVLDDA